MRFNEEVRFRLRLAAGFLDEAEQDHGLERWRSCVDNAQLTVENAGKAVLALFGIPPKTHDPARELAAILRRREIDPSVRESLTEMLPHVLALGSAEHFLTDYGNEANYTLPWDLFDRQAADEALEAARQSLKRARTIASPLEEWPEPPATAAKSDADREEGNDTVQ